MFSELVFTVCLRDKDPNPPITTVNEDGVEIANVFVEEVGAFVPWLDDTLLEQFESGKNLMSKPFTTETGLGPTFNADSVNRHQAPAVGGSASIETSGR